MQAAAPVFRNASACRLCSCHWANSLKLSYDFHGFSTKRFLFSTHTLHSFLFTYFSSVMWDKVFF